MLLLLIRGQYEKMIYGRYVEGLGLELSRYNFDPNALNEFLISLDKPIENDERILWPDNAAFIKS